MAYNKESDGVWRTIRGRRIFIRKGQKVTDAMRESGNFEKSIAEQSEKITHSFINIQLFGANYGTLTNKQLKKSRKRHEQNIKKHKYKIAHPDEFYVDWDRMKREEQEGRLFQWQKEIRNFKNQIKLIDQEFAKRGEKNGD